MQANLAFVQHASYGIGSLGAPQQTGWAPQSSTPSARDLQMAAQVPFF